MAKKNNYFLKIWIDDWFNSELVRGLSFEEKGLYFELLLLDWKWGGLPWKSANNPGEIPTQSPKDSDEIAVKLGRNPKIIRRLITRLLPSFLVLSQGRITNRRLKNERNSIQKNDKKNRQLVTSNYKLVTRREDEDEIHIPELGPSGPVACRPRDHVDPLQKTAEEIRAWWNSSIKKIYRGASSLREISTWNDTRKSKLKKRLAENPNFKAEVERELKQLSDFARENKFIQFDWLLSPGNLAKLLEGNYRGKARLTQEEIERIARGGS